MEYKYNIGDKVENKEQIGIIHKQIKSDNGKYPAYIIKNISTQKMSKWSESKITKYKEPDETFTSNHKYKIGDRIWRSVDSHIESDINIGTIAELFYSSTNNSTLAYKIKDKKISYVNQGLWHEEYIEGFASELDETSDKYLILDISTIIEIDSTRIDNIKKVLSGIHADNLIKYSYLKYNIITKKVSYSDNEKTIYNSFTIYDSSDEDIFLSEIQKLNKPIIDVPEGYIAIINTTKDYSHLPKDSYIKIKTKEQFTYDGISFYEDNTPKASCPWANIMLNYMGTWRKNKEHTPNGIRCEKRYTWSNDSIACAAIPKNASIPSNFVILNRDNDPYLSTTSEKPNKPTIITENIQIEDIEIGDLIQIKTKKEFEDSGIKFYNNGNPIVITVWDHEHKIQSFMGKTIKVTRKTISNVKTESWSWSLDCISKVIKQPNETYLDTSTGLEEEPETIHAKPEPIYTQLSIKDEIKHMMPTPILLEGPVGSGKSTLLMELAEELSLKYFATVMSDATTASEFKGYKNVVDGSYVSTEFREAYENGGMFVLEELNATTSNMPIIFNSLENGYFVFADKLVYGHKDFRLCATINTITNAHDFGGRRNLDKSVKSRFHTIIVEPDLTARFDKNIISLTNKISKLLDEQGHSKEIDPRNITRFEKLLKLNMEPKLAIQKTFDREKILKDHDLNNLIKEYLNDN